MSDCTACEHPVIIPEELRNVVTEIHTCEKGSETIYCPAQTRPARLYVDPEPAEYCTAEVADYGDYCHEHDIDDFDPWGNE